MKSEKFKPFVHHEWSFDPWNSFNSLAGFACKLQQWNKDVFGNIFFRKRTLLNRLEGIQKRIGGLVMVTILFLLSWKII